MRSPCLFVLALIEVSSAALQGTCAPGGNFELSKFNLQLPSGSTGKPDTISASKLEGCGGYQNSKYFFTEDNDGALVMKVPGSSTSSGCVTTAHSKHCRTELRESSPSSWSPNSATNKLSVSLAVPEPDESDYGTVIGQIHIDDSVSTKPVCELYYNSTGGIHMGVEQTRAGGNSKYTEVGHVTVGQKFSYEISYANNVLEVSINGASKTLSTYDLNAPKSYFKVGNYNQGDSPSEVRFFSISVQH